MKRNNKFFLWATVAVMLCIGSLTVLADDPNPPIVPGEHGQAGDVPVGAPIDGGVGLLLALGAGYGAKMLYSLKEKLRS